MQMLLQNDKTAPRIGFEDDKDDKVQLLEESYLSLVNRGGLVTPTDLVYILCIQWTRTWLSRLYSTTIKDGLQHFFKESHLGNEWQDSRIKEKRLCRQKQSVEQENTETSVREKVRQPELSFDNISALEYTILNVLTCFFAVAISSSCLLFCFLPGLFGIWRFVWKTYM